MFVNRILCTILVLAIIHHVTSMIGDKGGDRKRGVGLPNLGYGGRRPFHPRSCTRSSECRRGRQGWFPACCRDNDGGLLDPDTGGRVDELPLGRRGTCSFRRSGPREVCNDSCGCVPGYECYRTITGVCCPTKTCWTIEDAQRDRDRIQNCKPPKCFLPPVANPGK